MNQSTEFKIIYDGESLKNHSMEIRDLAPALLALGNLFKGKNPSKIIDLKNGLMRIEIDNETFDVPLALLRMYQDLNVRRAAENVVKPLYREGIDSFKIKDKDQIVEIITKNEVDYFSVPEIPEEEIVSSESEAAYSIVSLTFKDDNKWRLSDGNAIIIIQYHAPKETFYVAELKPHNGELQLA